MISDPKSFGEKVRALRKKKGLTLTELAEKTRRSISLLSQIETGNINPSFGSMQTIAEAFEISLGEMIADEENAEEEDFNFLKPSSRKVLVTQGGVQHQLLTRGIPLPFEFIIVEVPPGASTGDFLYVHDGEECGFLLEGELDVEISGQNYHLKPGDSITMKSNIPHRLSNPGKKKASAVWVNSAPYIFSTK
jgi:transcriptional regulator with XRE-family HTH domain